jgi:hypothetical protein
MRQNVHTDDGTTSNLSPVALILSQFTTDKISFHVTSVHTLSHIVKYVLYMQVKTDTNPSPLGKQLLTFAPALKWCKNCLVFQNCSIWIQSQHCTCVAQWVQLLHTTFLLSAKYVSVTSNTYLFLAPTVQTAYDISSVSCKQNHGFS